MPPRFRGITLVAVLVVLVVGTTGVAGAEHEGTNVLTFAPVAGSPSPYASGTGLIEFKGGVEPRSKWTATFSFSGLQPFTAYSVAVQGRYGVDGSADSVKFTALCSFQTNEFGAGGCWWYFRGLRRLNVSQLRLGDDQGRTVLQATRDESGPGSIVRLPV